MPKAASYTIIHDDPTCSRPLVIRDDCAPFALTITNDAERVVRELTLTGRLPAGRRLLYLDSEGELDELLHTEGRFAGFKRGSAEDRAEFRLGHEPQSVER